MVKYLNVAMDNSLMEALLKDRGNQKWVPYFEKIVGKIPKEIVKIKEEIKRIPEPVGETSKKEQLNNWTKYAEGKWDDIMIRVVNELKFKKKAEFEEAKEAKLNELKSKGYTEEQLLMVKNKVEDLKFLFLSSKEP